MSIKYIEKVPNIDEFNTLSDSVGWGRTGEEIFKEAMKHTLFSICVYDDNKLIGYGRIIGDKTIFLHIHSVKVHPEYQGKKIGTKIMQELLKKIDEYKEINPDIRTYLGAAKDKEGFYEKFGFERRPNGDVGAGMILY